MVMLMIILAALPLLYMLVRAFVLGRTPPKMTSSSECIHVLITGGSKGIGKELAVLATKKGAHVTIVARDEKVLEQFEKELNKINVNTQQRITTIALDLTSDFESIKQTLHRRLELDNPDHIPVDILVNNAGGAVDGSFEDLDPKDFEHQMRLNYLSAVFVTKSVVGDMKHRAKRSKRGCRIVFLSSQAGQVGIFGYTAYSASKFALMGFAQALQMELRAHNIWITVAHPPNTQTEGFANELLHMPTETRLISDTSGLVQPAHVAAEIWNAANLGRFCCYFGLDGWMIANLCCGMSPEHSLFDFLQQIFLSGVFRVAALIYLKRFDRIISSCAKN